MRSTSSGPRREEDHERVGEGPDPEEDLEPVEARQHDVEDDDVRREGARLLDGGRAVGGLGDQHPLALEEPPHDARIGGSSSTTRTRIGLAGWSCAPRWGVARRAVGDGLRPSYGAASQPTTVIVPLMPAS